MIGVDYAWHGPLYPREFDRAGYNFVARYLSHDPTKDIDEREARAVSRAGMYIVLVWESTAGRAVQGHAAGVQDAREAYVRAARLGMPPDRPVYFAVDVKTTGGSVLPYFDGVLSVAGHPRRVGVYGSYDVVRHLLDAGFVGFAWQTPAWSGGRWEPRADLRQGVQRTVAGVEGDVDIATSKDFGQWRLAAGPRAVAAPRRKPPASGPSRLAAGAQGREDIAPPGKERKKVAGVHWRLMALDAPATLGTAGRRTGAVEDRAPASAAGIGTLAGPSSGAGVAAQKSATRFPEGAEPGLWEKLVRAPVSVATWATRVLRADS